MSTYNPAVAPPQSSSLSGTQGHKWWTLAAVCFGLFMALIDVTIVNVALPTIQKSLNAQLSDLQWVISAYTLALAVFLVTSGRLGDIFGRKRMFMIGLALFTLGSLLCALSGDVTLGNLTHTQMLLGSRAIQGVGGSVMFPLTLAIITATFSGKERGMAIGIWGGVSGLGTAIGPLVGGVLVEKVNWQSIFFLNVPIGVVGILISAWAIKESRDERAPRSVDIFGLITVTISMFCLILALIQGNDADKGWTSGYILTLFGIAAVALIAFIIGELRLKNPMVDPRLFTIPSFTGAAIAGFALSAGMFSLFFFLALYFQNFLGFSALDTGLRFLPLSGLVFVGAPLAGRFTDKIGARPVLTAGLILLTVSVLLMLRVSANDTQNDWVVLLPAFIIGGLGIGMVNPPISAVAVGTVDRAKAGMASGVNGMCRQVGNAFGIALLGAVLTDRYNHYIHDRILAIHSAQLPASVPPTIVQNITKMGTIVGSTGLRDARHFPAAAQWTNSPLFPTIQGIVRASYIDGMVDILRIAAVILVIGMLASVVLIRRRDMQHEQQEAAWAQQAQQGLAAPGQHAAIGG